MKRGGKRSGAGRPKGRKSTNTLEKEAARAVLRARVLDKLLPLVDAQIQNALGVHHFMLRDPKTGKFERLTDETAILAALNGEDDGVHYYIYAKDPNIQAFTDLMNRALDKPMEQEQDVHIKGRLVVAWQR